MKREIPLYEELDKLDVGLGIDKILSIDQEIIVRQYEIYGGTRQ